jgi:serine/threonine-protein kinase
MSPEQATGDRQIDARSDVYALGAVLYEMLSGDPPHTGSTSQAVIAAVVTEVPRDVATRRPRLAPHVAEAVHRALEKLPADRFASAAEFAKALEGPAVTGRFAAAPARRGTRRRWVPAALVAAGVVLGLAGARVLFPAHGVHETRTRLTFTGDAVSPAVTNDGHWLAYIRGTCRRSGAACDGDLVVQELPRGLPSVVVAGASGLVNPTWSPDGANLLVYMRPAGGVGGLYVVQRAGGLARKVAGDVDVYDFADDRTAAYWSRGMRAIRLVDLSSGEARDSIVIGNGRWVLNSLSFNPVRGNLIAFSGILGSRFHQGVADRGGRILDTLNGPGGGGWAPDGRHMVVIEVAAQSMLRLVRIPVTRSGRISGRPEEILSGLRQDQLTGIALTPTGYVIGDAGVTSDVWVFTLNGPARRLTHSSTWYFAPAVSPDGRTVAYVKQDAWGANVYAVPAAGGTEKPVSADSGIRQVVAWSSDGRRISDVLVASSGSGAISQEVSELETGQRRVLPLEPGLVVVDWLPNGDALAAQISGRGLAVLDSTGRTVRQLPFPDTVSVSSGFTPSPDGAEAGLAASAAGGTRLLAMRLSDGALRRIVDIPGEPGVHLVLESWATDGYLYFSRVVGVGQAELWRLPARGGTMQRAATLPVACSQGTISLSHDARTGACLVSDDRPDLWLIERK